MKRVIRLIIVISFVVFIVSFFPNVSKAAQTPSLNKTKISIKVGKTAILKLKNATGVVSWKSSNKKIVSVSPKGVVKGLGVGSAKVVAKYKSKKYTCKVVVESALKLNLNADTIELEIGQNYQLEVSYTPKTTKEDTTTKWSSKNTNYCTVDERGLVTAVAPGKTEIVVCVGKASIQCLVRVLPPMTESLSFIDQTVEIQAGNEKRLAFSASPANSAEYEDLNWSCSDTSIVTITNGVVKGLRPGKATVTASKDGCSANCEVVIKPGLLTESEFSVIEGESIECSISDSYGGTLSWKIENDKLAEGTLVSNNGGEVKVSISGKMIGDTVVVFTDDKGVEELRVPLKVKDVIELKYETYSDSTGLLVFYTNLSKTRRYSLETATGFYDAKGTIVDSQSKRLPVLGPGETSLCHYEVGYKKGTFSTYKTTYTKRELSVNKSYIKDFKFLNTGLNNGDASAEVQYNGTVKLRTVVLAAVFYNGDKLVGVKSVYGDQLLNPGSTMFVNFYHPMNRDTGENYPVDKVDIFVTAAYD